MQHISQVHAGMADISSQFQQLLAMMVNSCEFDASRRNSYSSDWHAWISASPSSNSSMVMLKLCTLAGICLPMAAQMGDEASAGPWVSQINILPQGSLMQGAKV